MSNCKLLKNVKYFYLFISQCDQGGSVDVIISNNLKHSHTSIVQSMGTSPTLEFFLISVWGP